MEPIVDTSQTGLSFLEREKVRRIRQFHKQAKRHAEQERRQDKREQDLLDVAEHVLATSERIESFRTKLDKYDEATVAALMENQAKLDAARTRYDEILNCAYVMDDGRRVFKTEDSTQVFDEYGREVSREELDPDQIPDSYPTHETRRSAFDDIQSLEQQQEELIEYQKKLDEARERTDKLGLTENDIDDMEKDLEGSMPNGVREKLGLEAKESPAIKSSFNLSSSPEIPSPDDLKAEMKALQFN